MRVRLKVRVHHFRRFWRLAALALAAALAAYAGFRSFAAVSALSPSAFFSFRLKRLEMNCPAPAVAAEAAALFSARLNRVLSRSDCAEMGRLIKERYTSVSGVSVRRNFLNVGARVTVLLEPVLAPVLLEGGTTVYLSSGGKLMAEAFSPPAENGFRSEIYGLERGREAPAFAGFIRELGSLKKTFLSPPMRLQYLPREKICRLFLENGCEVLWGEFEFTRLKVLRLNEVLSEVPFKLSLPVKVDMRFFKEGRIFVSALRPAPPEPVRVGL